MKSNFRDVLSKSVLSIFLSSTLSYAFAGTHICTNDEAQEAESVVSVVKSWKQSHLHFMRYAHCDDGAIAEGFSESISVLLADHWKDILQLEEILKSDPDFRKFVIRHIDETIPDDRLSRIAKNADKSCPLNLKNLCRDILVAATPK